MNQNNTPIQKALLKHLSDRIVPFDVPGHKGGRNDLEMTEFFGERCVRLDVNSSKPLDSISQPTGVIKEAEELTASAFGAGYAFMMINGTTSAVTAMIMATVKAGEKVIMPRNMHRSAINTLVLCGAIPVYINPKVSKDLGISLGMTVSEVEEAIKQNPSAKCILVNNPTYYGICSDLKKIVKVAHQHGLKVLVDEAHGTHFYFGEKLPISAMAAGADMAAVSMHKTGGSLTQSSLLLIKDKEQVGYIRRIINLMQSTSGSYLLLASLDMARKNLALNGKEIFRKTIEHARYARDEVNKLGGYHAFEKDIVDGAAVFDFDTTKLSIHTRAVGLAGIEVYDILRGEYDIQIEFGDLGNILAIISAGDRRTEIERLIAALCEIKRKYSQDPKGLLEVEYIKPEVALSPQEAFYSNQKFMPIVKAVGQISADIVMCYPPGIPILAPGEKITQDIIDYIEYAKQKGCQVIGTQDETVTNIKVVEGQNGILVL